MLTAKCLRSFHLALVPSKSCLRCMSFCRRQISSWISLSRCPSPTPVCTSQSASQSSWELNDSRANLTRSGPLLIKTVEQSQTDRTKPWFPTCFATLASTKKKCVRRPVSFHSNEQEKMAWHTLRVPGNSLNLK